jgi:hypothetical protein
MIKVRRHGRMWLAAPAAVVAAVLGLTIPAQAQASPSARPTIAATTTARSLQSLDKERPAAVGGRWVVSDPVAYRQAVKTGDWVATPDGLSYKTCVYHAPDHAVVGTTEIVAPSGAIQRITPCTHPTLQHDRARRGHSVRLRVRRGLLGGLLQWLGPGLDHVL